MSVIDKPQAETIRPGQNSPPLSELLNPDALITEFERDHAELKNQVQALMGALVRVLGRTLPDIPRVDDVAQVAAGIEVVVVRTAKGERFAIRKPDGWTAMRVSEILTRYGSAATIPDDDAQAECTSLVSQIKAVRKKVNNTREAVKIPFDNAVGAVQSFFKVGLIDPLDLAAQTIEKGAMSRYTAKRIAEQKAAAEAARKAADELAAAKLREAQALVRSGEAIAGHATSVLAEAAEHSKRADQAASVAAGPAKNLGRARGTLGGVSTVRTTWRFKVTDPTLVPDDYWIIDEAKVAAEVRTLKEKTAIPGIEAYPEHSAEVR